MHVSIFNMSLRVYSYAGADAYAYAYTQQQNMLLTASGRPRRGGAADGPLAQAWHGPSRCSKPRPRRHQGRRAGEAQHARERRPAHSGVE